MNEAITSLGDQQGRGLAELSRDRPLMLVFLRHQGCAFAREALSDLARIRTNLDRLGFELGIVYPESGALRQPADSAWGQGSAGPLADVPRFADPNEKLYHAFGLDSGSWSQLLSPRVIWRGLIAALAGRHGFAPPTANIRLMPGVFLVRNGKVVASYRHPDASERPDYVAVARLLNDQAETVNG